MGDLPPPVRRFVIGTAGHIDHGKTALVKALTGVDTDRWEEEKRRGITIDLGFAPLPLGDAMQASVVDVPGHEGFVRNMLAGATGIDVALLVIAADEGIMPQTEEHLAIVELLGVRRGIPVITKCDLVEAEWLDLVRSIEVHGQAAERAVPGRRTALALVGVDKSELARGDVAVVGRGWHTSGMLDAAVELLPTARRPITARTRVRVHLGTAEVLARVVQVRSIGPGERGLVRLVLERPLVARGGDRFVLRSFSPVTTIGGGVVLDPFPAPRPRLRQRRIAAEQAPAGRLAAFAAEAGLGGLDGDALAVRLGVPPARVTTVIAEAGTALLVLGDTVVARDAVAAEATRLAEVLRRYHGEHPLDPGMSLQALRAAAGGGGGGGVGGAAGAARAAAAGRGVGPREGRFEIAGR